MSAEPLDGRSDFWARLTLPALPAAACVDHPELPWVPSVGSNGGKLNEMRSICADCPEREPCLEFALSHQTVLGIWGGTSHAQRDLMRKGHR